MRASGADRVNVGLGVWESGRWGPDLDVLKGLRMRALIPSDCLFTSLGFGKTIDVSSEPPIKGQYPDEKYKGHS